MTILRGRPMSPVEAQMDLMRSHVTRGVPVATKSDGGRTPRLAVPPGWTADAKCIGDYSFDESVGLKDGRAAARCEGCPVLAQCRAAAMEEEGDLSAGSRFGIRGGLSPKERAALAFAERACERGHRGRWGGQPNAGTSVCLECKAEDSRERYAARKAVPGWREMMNERQNEARSIQRVSCLGCKAEMRTSNLPRHIDRVHAERAA